MMVAAKENYGQDARVTKKQKNSAKNIRGNLNLFKTSGVYSSVSRAILPDDSYCLKETTGRMLVLQKAKKTS